MWVLSVSLSVPNEMLKLVFVAFFCAQALASPNTEFSIQPHIVGGIPANEGQFPFIVNLRDIKTQEHICGGALITDRYVLTAGHCVERREASNTGVGVGSVNLASQKVYKIEKFIIHPPSNVSALFNDIALLKLSSPVTLGGNVQTISYFSTNDQLVGKNVTEMGWGFTGINGPGSTKLLYLKPRPIISNAECQKLVGRERLIGPGYVCVQGAVNNGICYGDSGSPLYYKAADGKSYVVGVVVWGIGCAKGYPDVYTRVSHYANWIKENMK